MKTAKQMIDELLTIQEGKLKGAQRTPTKADIEQLMVEYHGQFENGYPKEFVEWILKNEYFWGGLSEEILTPMIDLPEFKILDELYEYWEKPTTK